LVRHQRAALFLNGGLGNGLILGPVLAALERALPDLFYFSPPNGMIEAEWVRNALRLRGPKAVLPPLWRRFLSADHAAILDFLKREGVTLVINLRKESADRDANYFAFKLRAQGQGVECWDLHDLDGEDLLAPIAVQAVTALRRHGVLAGIEEPAWLRHLYRPRPGTVGLYVGASVAVKRWPAERWSSLISSLRAEGRSIEVAAGPDEAERDIARLLAGEYPDSVAPAFLHGMAALRDWVAGVETLVSNDTVAVHLAAALGCPTVAIYLSTESLIWSPVTVIGTFVAVQSYVGRHCVLMKQDGTCERFYARCWAPCGDVDAGAVLAGLAVLADPAREPMADALESDGGFIGPQPLAVCR
jgi:hypothetical protein